MRSLVVALSLISSVALADPCGVVPPAWIADTDQAVTRTGLQTTHVFHKDGIETMVLRPGFTGSCWRPAARWRSWPMRCPLP